MYLTSLFKPKSQTSVPHIKFYTKNTPNTLPLLHEFLLHVRGTHMNNLKLRWNDLIYSHLF